MCMGYVDRILGVCGENRQEKVFLGYLAGVSSRQPDLGSGAWSSSLGRSLLGAYGGHNCFGSTCVGVFDTDGGYELAPV